MIGEETTIAIEDMVAIPTDAVRESDDPAARTLDQPEHVTGSSSGKMNTQLLPVDAIQVGKRARSLDPELVEHSAKSIKRLGLRTPITVRIVETMIPNEQAVRNLLRCLGLTEHLVRLSDRYTAAAAPMIALIDGETEAQAA